ncbi:MAG TPA: YggS family pyridoxal phosphate-dependent enzyme [Burkholderiales bacterium]
MTTIAARLQAVRARIDAAAQSARRPARDIRLVAVSKTFPAAAIVEAFRAGQVAFGENYLQEAVEKMALCSDYAMEWHHIGPIQSNKTRQIAELFHWVHGVDRLKIAQRLASSRPQHLPELQVCIQVNVSGEASKGGVRPEQVLELAQAISPLAGLRLRGLMAIPEPTADVDQQRSRFRQVRELKDHLERAGIGLDTLSMGMSDDLEAAVAEGATLVRVGRAIFGERARIPA